MDVRLAHPSFAIIHAARLRLDPRNRRSAVLPDLATQPLTDVPTSTLQDVVRTGRRADYGPNGQIAGTICVFDLKPLALTI